MRKPLIVIPMNLGLYPDQIVRLKKLGNLKVYKESSPDIDIWLSRVKDADIICSGKKGLKEKIYDLHDVFISLPFVATDWIDKEKIMNKKIVVASSPGCNSRAVSEWIIGMMINLTRKLPSYINANKKFDIEKRDFGLYGRNVCVLGKGNVGSKVGKICESLGMNVTYFQRGDSIKEKTRDADIIIDCLGSNETTYGLLGEKFFSGLKKGSYFITVTGNKIVDYDSMINALDENILEGAATDCGQILVGNVNDDFYKKMSSHPKILATSHLAYRTDVTARIANDMMIDNIEKWLKGKPQNIVK